MNLVILELYHTIKVIFHSISAYASFSSELCTFFPLFMTCNVLMTHSSNSWNTIPSHCIATTQFNTCTYVQPCAYVCTYNMHTCTQTMTPCFLFPVSARTWFPPKRRLSPPMFGLGALFTHPHCSFLDGENHLAFHQNLTTFVLPNVGTETILHKHCQESNSKP